MRKVSAAITFIFLFLSLQFGTVVSYLYCKWKAMVIEHKQDCGCDQQLAGAFGKGIPGDQLAAVTLTPLNIEYVQRDEKILLHCPAIFVKNSFAGYNQFLPETAAVPLLRPPAQLA